MTTAAAPFESLDYLYIPAPDFRARRDPGGQRLAVYERVRPGVERSFEGRFDT